jgi:hypothetical protein
MFDEKTVQELQYYVYMLTDPTGRKPFYIGKGTANRVFNHLAFALSETDERNLKYDKIRGIQSSGLQVEHVIVRHGLTEKGALQIEAALIDSLIYSGVLLTNKASGHNSIEKGLMTSNEVIRLYNAPPLDEIGSNCIIFNIRKNYKRGSGEQAIYQATKETWSMGKGRTNGIKYVLSEYKGLIVEVFEVEEWYEQERGYNPGTQKFGQKKVGYGFNGHVAPNEIREKYVNTSIAHKKKRGDQRVVRYDLKP